MKSVEIQSHLFSEPSAVLGELQKLSQNRSVKCIKIHFSDYETYHSFLLEQLEAEFNIEILFQVTEAQLVCLQGQQDELHWSNYQSIETLRNDAEYTNKIGFNDVWHDFFPKAYLVESEKFLLDVIKPEKSLRIEYRNLLAGMICLLGANLKDAGNDQTLAWVWISDDLSSRHRAGVRSVISSWLTAQKCKLKSAVYYRNVRSIKFHQKLGFKPICLRYTRF